MPNFQQDLINAWHALLPENIFISAGALDRLYAPLSSIELASVGLVDNHRKQELAAGRAHAKTALINLNIANVQLPKNITNSAPAWPPEVVGSITHTQYLNLNHVAVAVAQRQHYSALGIDAEISAPIHPNIWHQFLNANELAWILSEPIAQRNLTVKKVWSLKEAAIKANAGSDMLKMQVEKLSENFSANTFKLNLTSNLQPKKWLGHAICLQNATLAVVYSPSESVVKL